MGLFSQRKVVKYMKKKGEDIMLLQFRFKNYKSFADEAILDMTATTIKEHKDTLIEKNNINILPVAAIHGANANGKSSFLDALFAMHLMVVATFNNMYDRPLEIASFNFDDELKKEPTEFEMHINIEDKEYKYGFSATKEEIVEEWLYHKSFRKNSKMEFKPLIHRIKEEVQLYESLEKQKEIISLMNSKTLLLSLLGRKGAPVAAELYRWFLMSSFDVFESEGDNLKSQSAFRFLNESEEFFEKVKDKIREVDPCIKDIKITEFENENQQKIYRLNTVHQSPDGKKEYLFAFEGESEGTQKLFFLYFRILMALKTGGMVYVDELDSKVHPLVFRDMVKTFRDRELNQENAQLIFTCHNLTLLNYNYLRRDEVWFIDKDKTGKSQIYSLADFKVRSDLDYYKAYLSGKFGAIPYLHEEE